MFLFYTLRTKRRKFISLSNSLPDCPFLFLIYNNLIEKKGKITKQLVIAGKKQGREKKNELRF